MGGQDIKQSSASINKCGKVVTMSRSVGLETPMAVVRMVITFAVDITHEIFDWNMMFAYNSIRRPWQISNKI